MKAVVARSCGETAPAEPARPGPGADPGDPGQSALTFSRRRGCGMIPA
ncbi:hypothetical protein [Nocardioides convexus]|nr:hypothetical protein [Nocardioides convexus]